MDRRALGWTFVAIQVVLLVTLVVLPGRDDWPTPRWVWMTGQVLVIGGLGLVVAASLGLGTSLTATPVPRERGELVTGGLYRFVRHPIYTGVLTLVVGLTLRSGSVITLAVAVVTAVFFDRKARWEEAQLRQQYAGYDAYASHTPRFVPGWPTTRDRP